MLLDYVAGNWIVQSVFTVCVAAAFIIAMLLRRSVKAQAFEMQKLKDDRAFEREQWVLKQGAISTRPGGSPPAIG